MAGRGTDIKLGGRDGREHAAVVARGGLYVIGTNRHESLRVDQQLRGRSGRQGDPGSSRFFVSVEDPIIARYGIRRLMTVPGLSTSDEPTTNPVLRREIRRAQRIIEGENLDIRRRLWDYSEVVETQRQWIQAWRQEILRAEPPLTLLAERSPTRYARARTVAGDDILRRVEQRVTLLALDRHWSNHLAQMRWNRDRLALIGLVGKNPLAEFFPRGRRPVRPAPIPSRRPGSQDLRADRGHGRRRRLGSGRAPRPLVDLDLSGERSVPRQQRAAGPLAPSRRRGVGRDHAWSTPLPVGAS